MATKVFGAVAGNWNTDALWVGGVKPTAADDVTLTGTSANVTIDAASVCRSLDCTGYTGTLLHNAFTLTIGDGTAGASNIALKLVAGMTYTLANVTTSAITFGSTSATQQTVDCGGKSVGNMIFGVSGTPNFAITTAIATDPTTTLTSTFGHLHMDGASDNSGLSHSIGKWVSSASNTRTIDLGTSTITLSATSGTIWNMGTTALITFNAASSTIISTGGTGGNSLSFTTGNKTYGTVDLRGASEQSVGASSGQTATFTNLYRTGTTSTAGWNLLSLALAGAGTIRVTGIFRVNGETNLKRAILWPNSNGVVATLNVTGATLDITNCDFQDIAFVSPTDVDLSAITGLSGDAGGNTISGGGVLTFTPSTTQTWQTTGAGNTSDVTKWTSRVPLPQDTVIFSSAFSGSPTITADMWFSLGSIDFSSSTGNVTLNSALAVMNIVGNVTLQSGVTITNSASCTVYLNARTTNTITFNSATWSAVTAVSSSNGGNLTFTTGSIGAALQQRSGTITIPLGTTLTVNTYISNATTAAAVSSVVVNGTWNISGSSGTIFTMAGAANLTSVTGSGTIGITSTSASTKTFAGNGNSYPDVKISGGGSGAIIFTGANTFNRIYTDGSGTKTITLPGSTTTTILSHLGLDNGSNVITVNSSAGSATLFKGEGSLIWDYVSMTNIVASGNSSMFAGSNSTDNGGNTGWIFTDPPSGYNKVTIDDRLNKFFSDKTGILNRNDAERAFWSNASLDFS